MPDGTTTHLQQCIVRLQAGDPAARNALVDHACERLRRLAQALLRHYGRLRAFEDTDDILQSAVLRLLRALDAAPPESAAHFFHLAAQQIRRELIDLSRHYYGPEGAGAHQARALPDDGSTSTPHAPAAPSDNTHEPSKLARWTEFHEQVGRLPPDERAVVELIWYQGLSQPEAAAALGVSLATVKRRWMSARLHLHEALRDDSMLS